MLSLITPFFLSLPPAEYPVRNLCEDLRVELQESVEVKLYTQVEVDTFVERCYIYWGDK